MSSEAQKCPSLAAWIQAATAERKGQSPDNLVWRHEDGFVLPALLTEAHSGQLPHLKTVPGLPPYTRGVDPEARPWSIPVPVTVEDLAAGLPGIPLDGSAFLHLARRFASHSRLQELCTLTRQQGRDPARLRGTILFDPLGELVASGAGFEPFGQTVEESRSWLLELATTMPMVRGLCVRSLPFQQRGASPGLELGLCLATGVEYLRAFAHQGLGTDVVANHLAFQMAVGPDLLTRVAQLRAARTTWAQCVRAFGVVHKRSLALHLEAVTTPHEMALRDPLDNLVRSAYAAFAAVTANVEALAITPFDSRITAQEPGLGERLALQQHRLLQHECGLAHLVDPLGGSHVIEVLTDNLGRVAWSTLQAVEARGGMAQVVTDGALETLLAESAGQRTGRTANRTWPIIGTSRYVAEGPDPEPRDDGHVHRSDRFDALRRDKTTTVALVLLDQSPVARARIDFAKDLLRAGGHTVVTMPGQDLTTIPDQIRILVACAGKGDTAKAAVEAWRSRHVDSGRRLLVVGEEITAEMDAIQFLSDLAAGLAAGSATEARQ